MYGQIRKILCCLLILMIHLPAQAGEFIVVRHSQTLKPTISVSLSEKAAQVLNKEGLTNAQNILAIYLVNNGIAAQIPVAGTYRMEKKVLCYTPLYDLGYNLEFEVRFKEDARKNVTKKRFHTPPNPKSATAVQVENIYPLTDTVPYNTLYFHIRFNQPMKDDINAFKSVKVFDDKGKEIAHAWRHKSFWLDNQQLLVLMVHPGRVKSGIHYEGPLFDSGRYYTIQVGDGLTNRNGDKHSNYFSKQYFITGVDRDIPKVQLSSSHLPKAGSMNAISFAFSEGVDNASVLDGVKVIDEQENIVPCSVREKKSDRIFVITPKQKWKIGHYRIVLSGSVYDFAGNRLNRLFEITDISQIEADNKLSVLKFSIK